MKRLIIMFVFIANLAFSNTMPGLEKAFFSLWHNILKKGNYIIGGTQTGIEIRKINGNQTVLISQILLDRITKIEQYKNFIVARGDNALYFIDISNIENPRLYKKYDIKVNTFLIINNYLIYATEKDSNFQGSYGVYDISDIDNITLISSYKASGEYKYIGFIKDNYIGFVEDWGRIDIVDISDKNNLNIKYSIDNILGNYSNKFFYVKDNKLYTITANGADNDISIYEISDLSNIKK